MESINSDKSKQEQFQKVQQLIMQKALTNP